MAGTSQTMHANPALTEATQAATVTVQAQAPLRVQVPATAQVSRVRVARANRATRRQPVRPARVRQRRRPARVAVLRSHLISGQAEDDGYALLPTQIASDARGFLARIRHP